MENNIYVANNRYTGVDAREQQDENEDEDENDIVHTVSVCE